jgi:hypothetical protein
MQIDDFKSIVLTFADPGEQWAFEKAKFMISVNGDLIEADIIVEYGGDVYVDEGNGREPASKWILNRLAHLPLLASRLRESVNATECFVSPEASLLPTLDNGNHDQLSTTNDALKTMMDTIRDSSPFETTVLYVTSDAGEGKTSLINELARTQAKSFIDNRASWLLVPIPLGGRHFLRFDDITVGALQNRYRFPFLYYNSFLALVKMRAIVPAFDGFEEMFVESSSGEALSAMGILVSSLDSKGTIVIAARKAYFDFENLRTKEKLFDTIRNYSVGFGSLELKRWSETQFSTYCSKRGVANAQEIYRRVSERLKPDHALLTRAILVKRLIDVASNTPTLEALLDQLHGSGADFFSVFVMGLIEREANEKWIDRSGEQDVGAPLLTTEEHCELLSLIALEMWEARVDYIKRDSLEFVADYFSTGEARKNAFQAQQIKERIRGHAMLVPSLNSENALEFDHEEFRSFFLGEGIARQIQPLNERAKAVVLGVFRRGVLPRQTQHAIIRALKRNSQLNILEVIRFLLDISGMESQASYAHENCSDIIIRILSGIDGEGMLLENLAFGINALRDRKLRKLVFKKCYFSATSLELTELEECTFINSRFAQLRVNDSTQFKKTVFDECSVEAISFLDKHWESWDPDEIQKHLQRSGIIYKQYIEDSATPSGPQPVEKPFDDEIKDIEKLMRYFLRSTNITEDIIRLRIGSHGNRFVDETLPVLLKIGVMEDASTSTKIRFKVGRPLKKVNAAIAACRGSFQSFIKQFESDKE